MPPPAVSRPTGNHLLDRLPAAELTPLLESAKLVRFAPREEVDGLRWENQPVYFPTSGVYSLLLPMKTENPVRAVAQVGGACVRVPAECFLKVLRSGNTALDALVRRFLAVSWQTGNQTIACNLRHSVRERTARWLLSVHDRADGDEFEVTQEILSGMVGASRQKVTVVAGELQSAGTITYQRGRMRVLDRPALEAASCECYRVLRKAYDFLTAS